ncbi:hypothetical protein CYLTODRAFT_446076 [Cylindrobasidium torrendii FP15055 ss-10]|uniref:Uncharacterized protein n=1 Tax=Cylindrobasidium torrendii FP15055 ss-10 TaxID=1314674 RepID=A0A0D7B1I0_9AGAR|nr:hypothetical protein CYLTODRAFT_446076 [Cylindrobasidium torrendii FP15055 ss-10]
MGSWHKKFNLASIITLSVLYGRPPHSYLIVEGVATYEIQAQKVLAGSTLSWSYHVFIAAVVLMFASTTASLVTLWVKELSRTPISQIPLAVTLTMMAMNILIADIILTWRCWIIYGKYIWITILPVLGASGELGCHQLLTSYLALLILITMNRGGKAINVMLSALSFSVTAYCTTAITIRMLRLNRLEGRNPWTISPTLAILVESALPYTATLLFCIITTAVGDQNLSRIAQIILFVMAAVCPTWIMAKILRGRQSVDADKVLLAECETVVGPGSSGDTETLRPDSPVTSV